MIGLDMVLKSYATPLSARQKGAEPDAPQKVHPAKIVRDFKNIDTHSECNISYTSQVRPLTHGIQGVRAQRLHFLRLAGGFWLYVHAAKSLTSRSRFFVL
jgi:hypothetical protein